MRYFIDDTNPDGNPPVIYWLVIDVESNDSRREGGEYLALAEPPAALYEEKQEYTKVATGQKMISDLVARADPQVIKVFTELSGKPPVSPDNDLNLASMQAAFEARAEYNCDLYAASYA